MEGSVGRHQLFDTGRVNLYGAEVRVSFERALEVLRSTVRKRVCLFRIIVKAFHACACCGLRSILERTNMGGRCHDGKIGVGYDGRVCT